MRRSIAELNCLFQERADLLTEAELQTLRHLALTVSTYIQQQKLQSHS